MAIHKGMRGSGLAAVDPYTKGDTALSANIQDSFLEPPPQVRAWARARAEAGEAPPPKGSIDRTPKILPGLTLRPRR